MSCKPTKKDYYHNNNRYRTAFGSAYQVLDFAQRYTAAGGCSRVGRYGKLVLSENLIERVWNNQHGIPGVVVETQFGNSSITQTFGYGTPQDPTSDFKRQALAAAMARFKKKAQEKAILAMEYIAERRTLADQLSAICKKLVEIVKMIKQRKFKQMWKYSKRAARRVAHRKEMTIHEKWLEYHFAIAPMVDDLVKNIWGLKELHASKIRNRAFFTELVDASGKSSHNSYTSYLFYSYRVTLTGEVSIDDPAKASRSLIGLNPSDFYDVIPFSFLLDWLFNVGQIIKGLMVPGMTYVNTSVTTLEKRHYEHIGVVRRSANPTVSRSQIGGNYYTSNARYSRTAGPFPDIPLVWAGGVNSLWRAFTSLALARTIFST